MVSVSSSEQCFRRARDRTITGVALIARIPVQNSKQCRDRCLQLSPICQSVVYFEFTQSHRVCQQYNGSRATGGRLKTAKKRPGERIEFYELSADCPGKGNAVQRDQGSESKRWGVWSHWTKCSKSCGGGQQLRTRTCQNCRKKQAQNRKCGRANCPKKRSRTASVKTSGTPCNNRKPTRTGAVQPTRTGVVQPTRTGAVQPTRCAQAQNGGAWQGWSRWTACYSYCGCQFRFLVLCPKYIKIVFFCK